MKTINRYPLRKAQPKPKDSWSKEEVIALHKLNCERLTNAYTSSDIEWIKEKLEE